MLSVIKTAETKVSKRTRKGVIVMLEISVAKIAKKDLAAAHKIISLSKSKTTKDGVHYFKIK